MKGARGAPAITRPDGDAAARPAVAHVPEHPAHATDRAFQRDPRASRGGCGKGRPGVPAGARPPGRRWWARLNYARPAGAAVLTIVGSGKVGGDAALFSALRGADDRILLLDIVEGLPQGEAMDISHALSEQGIDAEVTGSNDYSDMRGSDVVVVVAGSGRKPGMTRMDLLKINSGIVRDVAAKVGRHAPGAILVPVTNPLDPMAYVAYRASGFDRKRVLGMGGMLDLSRFRQFIHEATGHSRDSIRALVVGEHGENMVPLPRFSSVSGIPLASLLPADKIEGLVRDTREVAARVIAAKGATVHAPGNAIASMVESIMCDRRQVMPVSAYLEGEYGQSGVCIGVPAVVGRGGIEEIVELDLDEAERAAFDRGAEGVRRAIEGMEGADWAAE